MFVSHYRHSLDPKGRVILPARFRSQLEEGAFMARGLDGCLSVYPGDEWERVSGKMQELMARGGSQRQAARSFFAGAAEVTPDRQGRIQIPAHLRDFANLSPEREVIVAGLYTKVEIWDSDRWSEQELAGERAITEAEDIPDFGI